MEVERFLQSLPKGSADKIVRIFKDIQQESSPLLLKQLDDRVRKYSDRLRHVQAREARLKDKLVAVSSVLEDAKASGVDQEFIKVLEGWHSELLSMLTKIDYREVEDKRLEISKVREKIRSRTPLVNKVLEELGNGSTT